MKKVEKPFWTVFHAASKFRGHPNYMKKSIYKSAARAGLIALSATGIAIAQEAEKTAEVEKPAEEAAEKPAEEKPTTEPAAEKPVEEKPAEEAAPESTDVKGDSSYAFGYQMGQQLNGFGIQPGDINQEDFLKGFTTGTKGDEPEISVERLQAAMQAIGDTVQKREQELAKKNLEAGTKFLEENGKREGVVTTDSGLQYEVLEKGGESKYVEPKEGEPAKQFMVHYKGMLIDGTEFDASPEGTPVPMTMQVIPGFQEALKAMPVGAKWKLFVPAALAYGEERRSADIAPNSTLIFELELEEIKDAPAAPAGFQIPGMPPQGQ